jgi:hypothetical protein
MNTFEQVIATRFKGISPEAFLLHPEEVALAFDLIVSDGHLMESRPEKVLAVVEDMYSSSSLISETFQSIKQMSKMLK